MRRSLLKLSPVKRGLGRRSLLGFDLSKFGPLRPRLLKLSLGRRSLLR